MERVSKFIVNHSLAIVIVAILLLIPTIVGIYNTKINYDILVYLPEDIETIKGQNILTDDFNVGAYAFVIVDNMSNRDILNLEDKIAEVDNVNQVISIVDVTDTTVPIDILPNEILDKVYKDNETIIVVTFDTSTSDEETMEAIETLREKLGDNCKISGMTAMVVDTRDLSNNEIIAYVIIAVVLCIIVLLLATDSYLVPIFLLGNIGLAILYNMGSNVILGDISYITKAISAVLQLGVTTDFSIFLYHKFRYAMDEKNNKKEAMAESIVATFKSVIGSAATTIAGFISLCAMDLTLGRDIGIVMAKGVLCGLICVLIVFPALLLVFDNLIEKTKHKEIFPEFKKVQKFAIKHYKAILVAFILLMIPAIYGNSKVNVYYKLDKSLPADLPSSIANSELAEKFGISSPEIALVSRDIKANDLDNLVEKIKNVEGVDLVLAPNNILDTGLTIDMLPDDLQDLLDNDKYQLIILNSQYEVASDELNNQIDEINSIIKSYDENGITAGEGALTKDLIKISDHDFKMVNYISIGVIFVLMLIVLKSISLPILLVCAIEFAIFVNMSIAYYTGVTLPFIASIVVGTIQLGATIDYAILMSTKYLEERTKEKDKFKAIEETLNKTVPSIIVSALCFFAATIGVGIYSEIDMIGSICNLLSRGAIISMLVVVLIVPALLLVFDKLIMKTTKTQKGGN